MTDRPSLWPLVLIIMLALAALLAVAASNGSAARGPAAPAPIGDAVQSMAPVPG